MMECANYTELPQHLWNLAFHSHSGSSSWHPLNQSELWILHLGIPSQDGWIAYSPKCLLALFMQHVNKCCQLASKGNTCWFPLQHQSQYIDVIQWCWCHMLHLYDFFTSSFLPAGRDLLSKPLCMWIKYCPMIYLALALQSQASPQVYMMVRIW